MNDLQANDNDFATMNFIIAGLTTMIFFNSFAVLLKIRKINQNVEIENPEVPPGEIQTTEGSQTTEEVASL